jgi:hypothetical protein
MARWCGHCAKAHRGAVPAFRTQWKESKKWMALGWDAALEHIASFAKERAALMAKLEKQRRLLEENGLRVDG